MLSQLPKRILASMCVMLLVSQILFIAGIDQTSNMPTCRIVAVILHFCLLSTFCWILVEGYDIYINLTNVFEARTRTHLLLKYSLFAIITPAIIIAIAAGAFLNDYGREDVCWLSTTGNRLIFAFAGPVAFVMVVNIVFFIRILMVVTAMNGRRKSLEQEETFARLKRGFYAAGSFFAVLGFVIL